MKLALILLTLLLSPYALAQSPAKTANDEKLRQILSHPVKQIDVKGLGIVEVGDVLVHKNNQRGLVKGLYINNEIPWVLFSVDKMSSFVYLHGDYFKTLEKHK